MLSLVDSLLPKLVHAVAIARSVLLEIFDESAYARFLSRHGLESSRSAYAGYLRETEASRGRRARCC